MFKWLKRLFVREVESPVSILDDPDTPTTRRQVSRGIYTPPRRPVDYGVVTPSMAPPSQNHSMDLLNPLNPISPLSPLNPVSPFSIYEDHKACDPPSHDHGSSFDSGGSCSSDSSGGSGGGSDSGV